MAPKSVARGAPRSGDRAAVGAETARLRIPWALASRYGVASSFGRHCSTLRGRARFYSNPEGRGFSGGLLCQAPREGDRPFPSSPFAHPIPLSRRRAPRGDLFRGSYEFPMFSKALLPRSPKK